MKRRHRSTSNSLAVQRMLHSELRQPHITPMQMLSNGQMAGAFAIEYVRNFNIRRKTQYEKKQLKEKIQGEKKNISIANDKKQNCKEGNDDQVAAETSKIKNQKGQTGVFCENIAAQHATS